MTNTELGTFLLVIEDLYVNLVAILHLTFSYDFPFWFKFSVCNALPVRICDQPKLHAPSLAELLSPRVDMNKTSLV